MTPEQAERVGGIAATVAMNLAKLVWQLTTFAAAGRILGWW